jgi:hypothetical protein
MKRSTSAKMVTFTYNEQKQPLSFNQNPTLEKKDFQDFIKRYRKNLPKNINLKYYACGEYGDQTQRPHYHAIIFNLPQSHCLDATRIEKHWQNGGVHVAPANMATINYTLKYLMKGKFQPTGELDDRNPTFALMSKKMGFNYLTPQMMTFLRNQKTNFVTLPAGIKAVMPRYFKNYIFTQSERAQMAKEAKKQTEIRDIEKFINENHRNEWKKDQIRKAEKALRKTTDKNL